MFNRNLEIKTTSRDETTCIYSLSGFLCGSSQGYEFQEKVRETVAGGKRKVLIDLENLERIDSSGIGILVTCMWSASRAGGGLALASLPAHVEKVLGIAMLLDHIEHADTVDQALAKLDGMTLEK